MAGKGEDTRKRILDTAQAMILDHGYAGVSVDKLIKSLGLTKGAFFHHFKSKRDLARTLIQRYSDEGVQLFRDSLARAQKLSDDPLQQFLLVIGLYEELFEGLTEPFPGCLLASYVYEMQQFDEETRDIINVEFYLSRKELTSLIEQIMEKYPPNAEVNASSLADGFMSLFEGAFVLSKSLKEADITVQQLRHYKTYVELLFRQ
ncbi:MAG: TetR/AcrR family transcriptional regulator [Gammaproteobacteria bacterium]|nr:TetR/AcrR family transcriptional regulator [Gammaproteobacteria bacterium]